ncbi:MAG: hypothetical protein WB952_05320 [Terriglobales bacterium]
MPVTFDGHPLLPVVQLSINGDIQKWLERLETMYADGVRNGDLTSQIRAAQQALKILQQRQDEASKTIAPPGGGAQVLTIEACDAMVAEYLERCTVKKLCPHCAGTGKIDVPNFDSRGVLIEKTKGDSANGHSNGNA